EGTPDALCDLRAILRSTPTAETEGKGLHLLRALGRSGEPILAYRTQEGTSHKGGGPVQSPTAPLYWSKDSEFACGLVRLRFKVAIRSTVIRLKTLYASVFPKLTPPLQF